MPFCPCDGRWVSLGDLSAGLRYTTVLAALRGVHGAQIIDQELSFYYVAIDVLLSGHMWPTR